MNRYFVTGIGTDVGKTVAAAILTRALGAAYWKPVQAGDLDRTDTHKVSEWAALTPDRIYPERYRLNTPASPHYAAARDGVTIQLADFELPTGKGPLVVEGAGGLHVPLNDHDLVIDLIAHLGLPVVLVCRNYLGSINHSLLSFEALQSRSIPVAGLIFNGPEVPATESIIQSRSGLPVLFRIPELKRVDAEQVMLMAEKLAGTPEMLSAKDRLTAEIHRGS
ncbi:MAG: dethiobiotin synthase [Saprospiraceae bacterium]